MRLWLVLVPTLVEASSVVVMGLPLSFVSIDGISVELLNARVSVERRDCRFRFREGSDDKNDEGACFILICVFVFCVCRFIFWVFVCFVFCFIFGKFFSSCSQTMVGDEVLLSHSLSLSLVCFSDLFGCLAVFE